MKTIETDRLILRDFTMDDLDDFYEYAKSPNVGPNAGWEPHSSKEISEKILTNFLEKDCEWAIVYKGTNKLIGSFGYHKDNTRNADKAFMIGYCLAEEYWGMGLMPEAVKRVIQYAFEESDCILLSVRHFPFNSKSKSVIEKCGFVFEGRMRYSYQQYNGEVFDDMCYSILKAEYELRKLAESI